MAEIPKVRGLYNFAMERIQRNTEEGVNRAVPPMAREGTLIDIELDAANEKSFPHKLKRKPSGWFLASPRGSVHAVVEVSSDANNLTLKNEAASPGTLKAKVWIW